MFEDESTIFAQLSDVVSPSSISHYYCIILLLLKVERETLRLLHFLTPSKETSDVAVTCISLTAYPVRNTLCILITLNVKDRGVLCKGFTFSHYFNFRKMV